ncbi:MAG: alpha/beta hydrolase [Candidatus Margulisiibacteriota bacterium]
MHNFANHRQNKIPRLFSGWAFDEEIFQTLDLPDMDQPLVIGWSQGVFAAIDFVAKQKDCTGHLVLISARPKYPAADIAIAQNGLKQNARGFLINFYRDCFATGEKEEFLWFKQNLMKKYLGKFTADDLSRQLDTLGQQSLNISNLSTATKITFIHGQNDKIAPVEEIKEFVSRFPQAKLIIMENCGHLPFLHKEFIACLKSARA